MRLVNYLAQVTVLPFQSLLSRQKMAQSFFMKNMVLPPLKIMKANFLSPLPMSGQV